MLVRMLVRMLACMDLCRYACLDAHAGLRLERIGYHSLLFVLGLTMNGHVICVQNPMREAHRLHCENAALPI